MFFLLLATSQDIGSSVLNGALSTFLAVAVLLFSSSYVFRTLSIQFALTVGLGVLHGLVLLPVALSTIGPKPYASAEPPHESESIEMTKSNAPVDSESDDNVKDEFVENVKKTEHAESFGDEL